MCVWRERWSVGLLQVLGLVVSPGAYVISEWNHLKFIVHPASYVNAERVIGCQVDSASVIELLMFQIGRMIDTMGCVVEWTVLIVCQN